MRTIMNELTDHQADQQILNMNECCMNGQYLYLHSCLLYD